MKIAKLGLFLLLILAMAIPFIPAGNTQADQPTPQIGKKTVLSQNVVTTYLGSETVKGVKRQYYLRM